MRNNDHDAPLLLEAGPSEGLPRAAASESPVSMARRLLRGRWGLAATLAGVLGVLCGIAGYFASPPMFTSTGLVEIKPTLPSMVYVTEDQKLPPLFESFVKAQAAYLAHPRVLDRAVNDPELRAAGWPGGAEGIGMLQKRLMIANAKGEQIIRVGVSHRDPRAAARAVNAVLKSYREVYGERAGMTVSDKETALALRARNLEQELAVLKDDLARQQDLFGPDVQARAFDARMGDLEKLNDKLAELSLAIAEKESLTTGAAPAVEDPAPAAAAPDAEPDPRAEAEAYASVDASLASILDFLDKRQSEYTAQGVRYGKNHAIMRSLRGEIDALTTQMSARVAQLKNAGITPGGSLTTGGADRPLSELKALESQYTAMKEKLGAEISDISRKRMILANKEEQINGVKERLRETQQALEETKTERKNTETGRVITQEGDVPVNPSSDKRIARAVGGMVAGMGMGVGVVLLLGLLRGNYRHIEDLEQGVRAPLLGTLPELTGGDGEHDELAAGSVHHVRNMLQLQHTRYSGNGAHVYAISSSAAGEGKTSLSLALGMSFAAAGHRTLLIDADLYGRGLTKTLGMVGAEGLAEASVAADLNGEVHDAGYPNVWAIPAGRNESFDAQNLSKPRMAAVLDKVREDFDVVVVDTGPLLGSIEANLAAALADGVVLMVTRGQDSKLVRACLKRIASVGGVCAGLVFNRAVRSDFERSVSSNSFRSTAHRLPAGAGDPPKADGSLMRALSGGKGESGGAA